MILYINGDSRAAAAEAVNPHGWAEDDPRFFYLGQAPHPDNLAVSWGRRLADALKLGLINQSQSGGSNDRILRVTRDYFAQPGINPRNHIVIIQWSTWERQEWFHQGQWYQIGASGQDSVPDDLQERYRQFVMDADWRNGARNWHGRIWDFHVELQDLGINHLFFNGDRDFSTIPKQKKWGKNYIGPYDPGLTFSGWLKAHGFDTVSPNSGHFGREAHAAWSRFVLQYIVDNKLVT